MPSCLCLDAPLVAAGWALIVAIDVDRDAVPWKEIGALFSSVWMIYLADRIWDVSRARESGWLPPRHQFAARHLPWIFVCMVLSIALTITLFTVGLDPAVVAKAAGIALVVGLYYTAMLAIRSRPHGAGPAGPRGFQRVPWKESAIGCCFAAGALVAARVASLSWPVVLLATALATLFTANCLTISRAEAEYDHENDPASFFSAWEGRTLPLSVILLVPAAAAVFLYPLTIFRWTSVSLLAGSFLTISIWHFTRNMTPGFVQPLADGVLLVPWIAVVPLLCGS